MKRRNSQPQWWLLFLLMPVYILLAWIFTRLELTGTLLMAAQIGSLLLIFFLANRWIGENERILSTLEDGRRVKDGLKGSHETLKAIPSPFRIAIQRAERSLLAAMIVLVATLLMALIGRSLLGEGVITLLYLVPIAWATVRWGRIAGASAALSAALCFDFFFTTPYYTFRIDRLEDWLLLALFMVMSVVVVGRVMTLFAEAKKRETENNFLYELVALMANLQTREEIAEFILDQLRDHYQAGQTKVILYQRGSQRSVLMVRNGKSINGSKELPERSMPIYSGIELIGKITISQAAIPLPGDDDPLLQSICHLVALAVDRAQPIQGGVQYGGQALKGSRAS